MLLQLTLILLLCRASRKVKASFSIKMCSNTDSPGRNGDGGGSWSPNSKKKAQNKRQRVPKRGPGVAELEKILREQEKKTEDDDHHLHNQVLEGRFNSCFISNDHSQPLIPMTKSIVLPPPSLYGNATGTNSNSNNNKSNVNHALLGRCIDDIGGGGGGGGSAVFLPEGALLPVTWTTAKTKTNINEEKSDGGVSLPNSTVFSNEYYQLPSHKKQPTSIVS